MMKCRRHDSSFFGRSRQRARERRLEPRDHHRVLLGEELADERRRIRVGAPEQAQEVLAAALRVARELERRDEHRRQDPVAGSGCRRGFALEPGQEVDPLLVHRDRAVA